MASLGEVETTIISTIKRLFKMDEVTHMASVELWVLLTTLLLVVRFLLDFYGPWHATKSMTRIIVTIEMINYSLVQYTIGLMQLSAKTVNEYFQVWAVLLVTLQYSVKIGRPYSRSKQIPLLDLMSSFWTANLLRVHTFFLLMIPLWLTWALNAARIISYFSSTTKADEINYKSIRLVADYMRYEHELSSSQLSPTPDADKTFDMRLYKYVILGEDQLLKDVQEGHVGNVVQDLRGHPRRRRVMRFDDYKKLVTVDKIWDVEGGKNMFLGDTEGQVDQLGPLSLFRSFRKNGFAAFGHCRPDQLKDVCLSFALYKMLRRRFYDLPVHEARLQMARKKARRLVFEYIIGNAERAFRIAAIELYFLQDLFYSKQAALFANGFPTTSIVLSLLLTASVGYIVYPVRYIPERMDQADRNRITHGVLITNVIIFLIATKELAEIFLYVFSPWTKVMMLCSYVKHRCMRYWLVETAMRVLLSFMNKGTWDERICQYNLLISTHGVKLRLPCYFFTITFPTIFPTVIKLEVCTKEAIFRSIKNLESSSAVLDSYFSRAFEDMNHQNELEWALGFEADTHKILVWHIATCLCEINLASSKAKKLRPFSLKPRLFIEKPVGAGLEQRLPTGKKHAVMWEHYKTAATLSNYCMHLVIQALVPDNRLVAKKVLREVCKEIGHVTFDSISIRHLLRRRSMQDVYDHLMKTVDMAEHDKHTKADEEASTFEDPLQISKSLTMEGAKLATQLMNIEGLWEKLAVFWTGFLLYLAASTRASKHRACLAGRRELTTHLWALLSHAGFLGSTAHGHMFLDLEQPYNPSS